MALFLRASLAALLLTATTAAFAAGKSGISLEDRRQAACYDDVQRLCPGTIPDATKAEACMKDKKSQVSKKCAALFDVTE